MNIKGRKVGHNMKWAIAYTKNKCPHCNENNIEYAYVLIDEKNRMGYMNIWCNNCKKMGHISRVSIPEDAKNVLSTDEEIEENIPKYKITY